jgi:hypothetical protein
VDELLRLLADRLDDIRVRHARGLTAMPAAQ